MKRYLKLIRIFVMNSVQLELEYRLNFVFNIVNSVVSFGAGFIVLYVMFANAENIGGWSFTETLVLYGVFLMMEAFIDVLMYPNLNRIPEYIRTGNMDFLFPKTRECSVFGVFSLRSSVAYSRSCAGPRCRAVRHGAVGRTEHLQHQHGAAPDSKRIHHDLRHLVRAHHDCFLVCKSREYF